MSHDVSGNFCPADQPDDATPGRVYEHGGHFVLQLDTAPSVFELHQALSPTPYGTPPATWHGHLHDGHHLVLRGVEWHPQVPWGMIQTVLEGEHCHHEQVTAVSWRIPGAELGVQEPAATSRGTLQGEAQLDRVRWDLSIPLPAADVQEQVRQVTRLWEVATGDATDPVTLEFSNAQGPLRRWDLPRALERAAQQRHGNGDLFHGHNLTLHELAAWTEHCPHGGQFPR